eukprot:351402-Chlamydomonas_euryale.AAC.1
MPPPLLLLPFLLNDTPHFFTLCQVGARRAGGAAGGAERRARAQRRGDVKCNGVKTGAGAPARGAGGAGGAPGRVRGAGVAVWGRGLCAYDRQEGLVVGFCFGAAEAREILEPRVASEYYSEAPLSPALWSTSKA